MDELLKFCGGLTDIGALWLFGVLHPVQTLERIAAVAPANNRTRRIATLYLSCFVITLLIYSPMLHLFGIEVDNVGFVFSNLLAVSLTFLSISVCVHFSMRIHRQRSTLFDTIWIYNTPIAIGFPITSLLFFPGTYRLFSALSEAKHVKMSLYQAMIFVFREYPSLHPNNDSLNLSILVYLSIISFFVSTIYQVISMEALVQIYSNDRVSTYKAVADGSLLGVAAAFVTGVPVWLFTIYAFVTPG